MGHEDDIPSDFLASGGLDSAIRRFGDDLIGKRIGVYHVTLLLGAGGMGEVYRARDTRLGRDVAIKILPPSFASDPERLRRFEREARMLAALNHPHIGAIYGLEEADPSPGSRRAALRALVLELVEGETLADRVARGPVPVAEALVIAQQIADALEAAHGHGIIHCDLKPANVKVTPQGVVKVFDFGLAKAFVGDGSSPDLSQLPTVTVEGTREGVIAGTPAYMSAEQARGKVVDKRSDIWAFGCVLYEMLTGRRAFPGEDVTDTLAAVVRAEPDWSLVPRDISPTLLAFLRRSLQKDPKQRVGDIRDMRLALEGAFETAVPQTAASPARGGRLAWMAFAGALLAAAVLAVPAVRYLRETPPPSLPETRTDINTPATTDPISFALSPDGRQIVFVSSGEGQSLLWLRPLGATSAQPLPGTEGAADPFWSPDSKSVAFFAEAKLKRIEIGGGRPQTIADASATGGRGGTWNQDGVILFTRDSTSPLSRVPASGGEPAVLTTLDSPRQSSSHRFPSFLPGGRQFLFYVAGSVDARGIYLGTLDSAEIKRLTPADVAGAYVAGSLLYLRQGALVAQRLDLSRGALTGDPVTIADPVGFDSLRNIGAFSASATDVVAYRTVGSSSRQLVWFDRSGKALGTMGAPDENGLDSPRLSPDGRRVAVTRTVQNNSDVWLLDGARTTRFTFDASLDLYAVWSRDGSQIAFSSARKGPHDLYVKPSSGAGSEQLLLESPQNKYANAFSPDGRFLLYASYDPKNLLDVWVLPLDGDRKPFVFLNTPFNEFVHGVSPDGRWVSVQSDESGRFEVYVRPFPGPGGQWQVSTSGGSQPVWRADGKELFYVAPDGRLMAATIAAKGPAIEPGTPVALFQTRLWGGGANVGRGPQYDVAPDGRFLMDITAGDSTSSPITLLLNWSPPAK